MKKQKGIGFGIYAILCGILLAGCNGQQDVSNEHTRINEGVHSSDNGNVKAETKELDKQTGEATENKEQNLKEIYDEKLRGAKEQADNLKPEDSSTYALKAMENKRWEIWDQLLNEIYGDLKEMLSEDEMSALRTEQRKWLELRDKSALDASQKYKGGTMEHLEYVSVLANLTEQRCYELVNQYMK